MPNGGSQLNPLKNFSLAKDFVCSKLLFFPRDGRLPMTISAKVQCFLLDPPGPSSMKDISEELLLLQINPWDWLSDFFFFFNNSTVDQLFPLPISASLNLLKVLFIKAFPNNLQTPSSAELG